MPKRCVDWNLELSKKLLASKKNRRDFFLALIEDGLTWREALSHTIKIIGIKEYALLSDFKESNLITQLNPDKDIRLSTLERMTSPLGVKLSFLSLQKVS